jgi:hypothetical protein
LQIPAIRIEQLLFGRGVQLGIGIDRCIETLQIAVTQPLRDHQHRGLSALDLVEADLVNLVRRHVERGISPDAESEVGIAIGNRPDAGLGATVEQRRISREINLAITRDVIPAYRKLYQLVQGSYFALTSS